MKKLMNVLILMIALAMPIMKAQVTQLTLGDNNFVYENNKWWIVDNISNGKYQVALNSFTVKLAGGHSLAELSNILIPLGIFYSSPNILGFIDLTLPQNLSFQNAYQILSTSGLFSIIEINSYGKDAYEFVPNVPNDPYYPVQYYLNQTSDWDIDAPEAWSYETGSTHPIVIGVVDHGVNWTHPDLNMWPTNGWDFINGNNLNVSSPNTHGTAVSGIFGAHTNNSVGISGVAGGWGSTLSAYGSQIMALKTELLSQYIDDAIIWAANHGAKIINMSFTENHYSSIDYAIEYAYNIKGCLLVAASGNDGAPTVLYPASHPDVMAVGGTFTNSQNWGNYGSDLEITAPAVFIYTTQNNNSYGYWTGTSFSTPMVAGGAALLWSSDQTLINFDVRQILKQTAYRGFSGYDQIKHGMGLLKLTNALSGLIDPGVLMPLRPTDVILTGTVGQHPTISWTRVDDSDIHHYNVYRSYSFDGEFDLVKVAEVIHNPNLNTHSWVDNSVTITSPRNATSRHYYRVTTVQTDNSESYSSNEVTTLSNWAEKDNIEVAKSELNYELFYNYPNPFNPSTQIAYTLKEAGHVTLKVYDVLGREIMLLVNENQDAGKHKIKFEASDLPSGVYLYKINSGNYIMTKKMILTK